MPTFSKFISSQRGAQQILDSDGYIYSRKKSRDTALTSTWRCAKYNPPTKCKCHIYLTLADNSITLGTHPHNHSADDRGVRVIAFSTTRNMKTFPPSKRRRTCHAHLHDICSFYSTYPSKIEYVFTVAKYFGNDIE